MRVDTDRPSTRESGVEAMGPRLGLAGLIAAVAIAFAAAVPPAAATTTNFRHCRGRDDVSIRTHDVGCRKARRVVAGFLSKAQAQGPDIQVRGFRCAAKGFAVTCRRGRRVAAFRVIPGL